MKTERRHELQTNVLATKLAHWTEAARPYGRAMLAGIIALIVAIIVWGYVATQNRRQVAEGWNDYFMAVGVRDEQRLQDVAEQFSGTVVADFARLTLADWELDNGTNRLLTDRALAREQLRDAAEKYSALLLSASSNTIEERATYGLARAHEAAGELEKARSEYRALAQKWPDSPFAATSEARAKALDELPTKQFYDWIAKYEPPKALSQEPGTPGARPDFLKEPDAGTLQMPSSLGDTTSPFPSLPSATESKAGEQPAAEPASTPELPAADAPATAPAEPAPAEPAPAEPAAPAPADEAKPAADGPELE
jgi:hypothetical protein